MYAIDWICLAVVMASLLLGGWRGFLYEVFSLGGWVAAYFVARAAADPVAQLLPVGDGNAQLRHLAAFALLFIAVAFVGSMVAWGVRGTARALGMRPTDRVFGALFGALRGALLLLVAAAVLHMADLGNAPWWRGSLSAAWLDAGLLYLRPLLPAALAQYLVV